MFGQNQGCYCRIYRFWFPYEAIGRRCTVGTTWPWYRVRLQSQRFGSNCYMELSQLPVMSLSDLLWSLAELSFLSSLKLYRIEQNSVLKYLTCLAPEVEVCVEVITVFHFSFQTYLFPHELWYVSIYLRKLQTEFSAWSWSFNLPCMIASRMSSMYSLWTKRVWCRNKFIAGELIRCCYVISSMVIT